MQQHLGGRLRLVGGRPPHLQDVHGIARLELTAASGSTRLAQLYQRDPLRVLRPYPAPGDPLTAVLVTTSGGLVGGDRLQTSIAAAPGSSAMVVAQAAEKVYRSTGPAVDVSIELQVGDGAWLEWLPQETILFDGARLSRDTCLRLAPSAEGLAGELLVLGRVHSGERFHRGCVRESWRVSVGGRLLWADALTLQVSSEADLRAAAGFGGAAASATLLHWSPRAAERLELAREALAAVPTLRAGATLLQGLLLVRWLALDPLTLRRSYAAVWTALRAAVGLPARLPRLWHV